MPRAAPAAAPTPTAGAVALETIGWASDYARPAAEALVKNREALGFHRRGQYDRSLAGFEETLTLAPSYAMARYNRACALARLGRFADAVTDLERLMREDLPTFGVRVDGDEDLAALRAAPEGVSLLARRGEIAAAYGRAVAEGVPATRSDRARVTAGASTVSVGTNHVFGVWVASVARFVPVTARDEDAFAIVYSSEHDTATVLRGPRGSMYYSVFPTSLATEVVRFSAPGTVVVAVPDAVGAMGRLYPDIRQTAVDEQGDLGWSMKFEELGVRPFADGVAIEISDGARTLRADFVASGPTRGGTTHDGEALSTVGMVEGVVVSRALPPGYAIERGALTVPGAPAPIALPRGEQGRQVVESSDASAAFVSTVRFGCSAGGNLTHTLTRIDRRTFETRELDRGPGGAMIVRARDGRLFVQVGDTERSVAPDGTLGDAGLPAWLSLVTPLAPRDCSM